MKYVVAIDFQGEEIPLIYEDADQARQDVREFSWLVGVLEDEHGGEVRLLLNPDFVYAVLEVNDS